MISIDDAIRIQSILIDKFGGSDVLRDKKLLFNLYCNKLKRCSY